MKHRPGSKNTAQEYNFDGLPGPTHNYSGLSSDNRPSFQSGGERAYPLKAALQVLNKMKLLMDGGFPQALFPPHERPYLPFLHRLALRGGSADQKLKALGDLSFKLLASCYSASSQWAAGAATISPGADTKDGRVHISPANLNSHLHRHLECDFNVRLLKKTFPEKKYFTHHPPLPFSHVFSDEGAANHNRFCGQYHQKGVEVFTYGCGFWSPEYKNLKPRQTREASQMLSLRHNIRRDQVLFLKQKGRALRAGAFHGDLLCAADRNLIFYHEEAFEKEAPVFQALEKKLSPLPLLKIKVKKQDISLKEALSSYVFNSQLLSLAPGKWWLLAPQQCQLYPSVKAYLKNLKQQKGDLIKKISFVSLTESVKNGGGPACLRLRVVLSPEEGRHIHRPLVLNTTLYKKLKKWIHRHYRTHLDPEDLKDPHLMRESYTALDELTQILKLGSIYFFQK